MAPPSLPGIAQPPGVFCAWRQTRHEVSGGRNTETADSVTELRGGAGVEAGAAHRWRQTNGAMPAACRLQTELPSGPDQEPVLLLRLRTGRRCDSLCRVVSRSGVQ